LCWTVVVGGGVGGGGGGGRDVDIDVGAHFVYNVIWSSVARICLVLFVCSCSGHIHIMYSIA